MNESPTKLTDSTYWDSWWSEATTSLDDPIPAHECQYGSNGFFLRAIERRVGPLKDKSAVELGGSMSQRLLAMIKWRSVRGAIIDYSAEGIAQTKRMYRHNGCDAEMFCGDYYDSSLVPHQYDLVAHWGVIEHERDPIPLVQRSLQLTKPGGFVIFTMPEMRGPGPLLWSWLAPENWKLHVYHSSSAITEAFLRCGVHGESFSFGAPMVYIGGVLPKHRTITRLANQCQLWATQLGRVLPYHRGLRFISQYRGFACQKPY